MSKKLHELSSKFRTVWEWISYIAKAYWLKREHWHQLHLVTHILSWVMHCNLKHNLGQIQNIL